MATSFHSKPISTLHLSWAAGFIEGEGCFTRGKDFSAQVSAAQVQKEPLERLQSLFGGLLRQRKTKGFGSNPIWIWTLPVRRSIEVMMTLYVLMSPRRQQQIENAINQWKSQKRILRPHGSDACGNGHELTPENIYIYGTHRKCKACMKLAKMRRRSKLREAA